MNTIIRYNLMYLLVNYKWTLSNKKLLSNLMEINLIGSVQMILFFIFEDFFWETLAFFAIEYLSKIIDVIWG